MKLLSSVQITIRFMPVLRHMGPGPTAKVASTADANFEL